jgi:hypothetical protein
VDLPEVEVVGLQAPERLLELADRGLAIAAVRADLGHQEDLVAAAAERFAHEGLAASLVVLPRVVHERDAGVHGLLHEADGLLPAPERAEVEAAETEDADLDTGAAEGTTGDALFRSHGVPPSR